MRRAFTLIELLVIVAILAVMVSIGVGSVRSGQGAARVKGATRDVYAAIRHARSVALVTGQRVIVNYSNETDDGEPIARVEVVSAKIMNVDESRPAVQPYAVENYKDLPAAAAKPAAVKGETKGKTAAEGGETLEEVLFSSMGDSVVKGMRILVKKGDEALVDETAEQARSRISVFSNIDYLQSRYKATKAAAEEKKEDKTDETSSGSVNDMNETVSVVWETNGAVEPHRIWIYPDGKKPEEGLMLNVDSFGAVKVCSGDGREED